ncbi:hypothetical protein P775_00025 [Puniceibacterium antarcticum]|uniref:Toxin n=1 Tax=Puniceibacterium antarcticum TaxID=1206336 RepID=A0A2G8RL94_9RHOB|nr:hypothetical protein P775_00025 [Puniceibacterium antarcticum]
MSGDSVPAQAPLVVNGWSIYAHPLFLDQLEGLTLEVEARKARDPKTWRKKNSTKRLAAIFKLVTEAIPADPGAAAFRQGGTLGDPRKGRNSSSSIGCSTASTAMRRSSWWHG